MPQSTRIVLAKLGFCVSGLLSVGSGLYKYRGLQEPLTWSGLQICGGVLMIVAGAFLRKS